MESSQREFLRKLGKEICTARKRLKMSQAELAEKADLSVTYISKIECGHRNFSVHTMAKIAQVLKLPQYKIIEVTFLKNIMSYLKTIRGIFFR